ncbi:hypothetical protein BC629DRAFT_1503967 [Irpex lacteus]|nr:hypothetical protein BC629DRAFT_1503967 [Irpex lacteus]
MVRRLLHRCDTCSTNFSLSGRIWTDLPESEWYERHWKSSHILQTQLKKKIRGSVH